MYILIIYVGCKVVGLPSIIIRLFYTVAILLVDRHDNALVKALQQVMNDDFFKINTPAIINARKCAENLLNWCLTTANLCRLNSFSKKFTECLQQVIQSSATKSFTYNKEKLWIGMSLFCFLFHQFLFPAILFFLPIMLNILLQVVIFCSKFITT